MGFLDGDIATLVGSSLIGAGMSKPATLIRITPGSRTPGAASAGTNPTSTSYNVQAIPSSTTGKRIAGTLIVGVDRLIKIYSSTLRAGITPQPGDKIVMDGATSVIVGDDGGNKAVTVDAAGAIYTCQCRS